MRLSLCSLGDEPTDQFLEQCRLAEILGFHAYYHADEKWTRDCYVRLGAAATVTTRLRIGVEIADPYTRHPALLAQMMATLADMAPGRVVLAIGTGSHFETLPGYENIRPLTALREAIGLIRRLWAGERVTLDGKVIKFNKGQLDFIPRSVPEVWIASRGPQILALAGEIADGVIIASFSTPAGVEWAKRHIAVGLERAGRTWSDIKLMSWLYTHLKDDDSEPTPQTVRRGISHAFWSSRNALFDRIDELAPDVTDEFRAFVRTAPHEWSPEVMAELRRLLPGGLFETMGLVGGRATVTRKLQALEEVGIHEAILWPFPKDDGENLKDVIAKLGVQILPALSGDPQEAAQT